ncbi:hypothetical protein SSCI18S_00432 [Sphingobium scionense]|uniref:DUF3617 family protein n=1 Tax=Sphingobium scionense TaxID=1404341 RepID=A0A7W6LP61_9SPHN|nr:hypothetical protein [Sphingobium scionense]
MARHSALSVSALRCGLSLALLAAIPVRSQSTLPVPAENDIVVIARKMRQVKIDYAAFGTDLRQCVITRSSGDARIDRIMCAMLSACVREGVSDPAGGKACINAKIASFEDEVVPVPAPVVVTEQVGLIPKEAPPAPPKGPPIVVTGRPNPILAGQWAFSQHQTVIRDYSAHTLPIRTWNLCIPDGTLDATIEVMLQDSFAGPGTSSHCSRLTLAGDGPTIRGDQRCWIGPGVRMRGKIEGEIGPRSVEVRRNIRLTEILSKPIRDLGTSIDGDVEFLMSITGTRVGNCRPQR